MDGTPPGTLPFLLFENLAHPPRFTVMMDGVPGVELGQLAVYAGVIGLLVLLLLGQRRVLSDAPYERAGWFVCALNLFGTYTLECDFIDEVYTNLEHPWNLYHHGRFSVEPHSLASGTADIVYYGLLTPFAQTHLSLTSANFIFGYSLALIAIGSLWTIGQALGPRDRLLITFACTFCTPFVQVMSDGLGTPVIGAGMLASLALFERRPESNLGPLVAAALPFLRPDALPVSAVVLIYVAIMRRRLPLMAAGVCGLALAGYFVASRVVYQVWVPTPLVFKAFRSPMLEMLRPADWLKWLDFFRPRERFVILAVLPLAALAVRRRRLGAFAFAMAPLLGQLIVIYAINTNPIYDTRYAIGLEAALLAALVLVVAELQQSAPKHNPAAIVAAGVVAVLFGLNLHKPLELRRAQFLRASDLGYGGQAVDRLMPPDWRLAVTEMNTIGFVTERTILDLWGYSNPRIAASTVCFARRVRADDHLFLDEQPEVFLFRTGHSERIDGARLLSELQDPTALVTSANMSPYYNQLGDMREVLRRYQAMALRDGSYISVVFVRADKAPQFIRSVQGHNYTLKRTQPLDEPRLRGLYDPDNVRRFRCG